LEKTKMKTLMLVAVFALSATVASAENVPLPQPRPTEADMAYQATQDAWSNLIGREDPDKPAVVAEVDKPAATIADSDKPAPVMEEKVTKPGGIGSDYVASRPVEDTKANIAKKEDGTAQQ
jgi:hypothetical protein